MRRTLCIEINLFEAHFLNKPPHLKIVLESIKIKRFQPHPACAIDAHLDEPTTNTVPSRFRLHKKPLQFTFGRPD